MDSKKEKKEAKVENYLESEEEEKKGHEDVRNKNFECEKPDPNLGCDPEIDVPG